MGEYPNLFYGWGWEENKLFELALAVVDEDNPDRWEVVSAIVGGKTAQEVEKHYEILLQDLQSIESGNMDHRFEAATLCLPHSACWTDEDQKSLVNLEIN